MSADTALESVTTGLFTGDGGVEPVVGRGSFTEHTGHDCGEPCAECGVDELCRRMGAVCESAVDPLEIAATLEADGLSDQTARTRYGFPDVFSLAEQMYSRVSRRPAEPPATPEPWRVKPAEHVLRGVLYALPAVCFPAVAPLLTTTATRIGFIVATLVSWALSQGLAYLGHARASRLDPGGSLRVLRGGTVIGLLVLWGALGVTALLVHARIAGLVFAGGQGTYLLAATVLLVCGAQRWLLACLAPGVLTSVGFLILGRPVWLEQPVWWALGASVLVTVAFAVVRTARPAPAHGALPLVHELRAALPHALFGCLVAGLLAFPVVASHVTPGPVPLGTLLPVSLSLSMGAAEWSLYHYRRRTHRLLRATSDPREFASGVRRVLLDVTIRYVVATALLIAATAGATAVIGTVRPQWTVGLECASFLALGSALFVALLLQALGGDLVSPLACAAALAAETVPVLASHVDPVSAQLVVCTALAGVLLGYAAVSLGRAVRHV